MIDRKMTCISYYNPNKYDYYHDTMGGEDDYEGFRSVIFYFKLSDKINLDKVKEVVKVIVNTVNKRSPFKIKLHPLFLNSEEYKLLHPKYCVKNYIYVNQYIDEYYDKYTSTNQNYSNTLKELFPPIGIYSRTTYPKHEDLCIVFQDDDGIEIEYIIKSRVLNLKRNFIFINAQNEDIKIIDGLSYFK